MMRLTAESIRNLGREPRVNLINSISGFKPANLVGTVDGSGVTNLAIMTSVVHIGAAPPLLALVVRPDSVERHTLQNIRDTGVYTINHVAKSFVAAAHQTAARYPKSCSEFEAVDLSEYWDPEFAAPFVSQASVKIGMRLEEEHHLAINGTHLLIGSVQLILLPPEAMDAEGAIDPSTLDSVAVSGLDTYFEAKPIARFSYAKPDQPLKHLT
ncbi:MAG: flavin reductase [Pseudomonadota bacterium]